MRKTFFFLRTILIMWHRDPRAASIATRNKFKVLFFVVLVCLCPLVSNGPFPLPPKWKHVAQPSVHNFKRTRKCTMHAVPMMDGVQSSEKYCTWNSRCSALYNATCEQRSHWFYMFILRTRKRPIREKCFKALSRPNTINCKRDRKPHHQ